MVTDKLARKAISRLNAVIAGFQARLVVAVESNDIVEVAELTEDIRLTTEELAYWLA